MDQLPFVLSETELGRFLVVQGDLIGDSIARGEGWDMEIMPVLQLAARRGGSAIDAGANIGFFAVQCAPLFAQVYAFEPQRAMFYNLCANLLLNGCNNVFARPVALADKLGTVMLARSEFQDIPVPVDGRGEIDYAGFANFGAVAYEENVGNGGGCVAALPLDALALDGISFIKVDCQGMDLAVLRGAAATIARCRPVVVFESERDLEASRGISRDAYLRLFAPIGYVLRVIHDHQDGKQLNFVAFPAEESEVYGLLGWPADDVFDMNAAASQSGGAIDEGRNELASEASNAALGDQISDEVWKRLAESDPYWGVLSMDRFRGQLNEAQRAEIYELGEGAVASMVAKATAMHPALGRGTAIDFGCGVGRLTRALAKRFDRVIAVDISPAMLDICVASCAEGGRTNVQPVLSDDSLSGLTGVQADLIVSSITFQHIRPARGMLLLEALFNTLKPGGAVAMFLLVAGAPAVSGEDPDATTVGEDPERFIEMNVYPLDEVLLLASRYTNDVRLALVPTGGQLGADIYFVRNL